MRACSLIGRPVEASHTRSSGITPDLGSPYAVVRHHANRLNLKGVIIHPSAYRIPEESRLSKLAADLHATVHELRKSSTVRPNDAPPIVVVIEDIDLVLVLEELRQPDVVVVVPRHSERFAAVSRIVVLGGKHGVLTFERVM